MQFDNQVKNKQFAVTAKRAGRKQGTSNSEKIGDKQYEHRKFWRKYLLLFTKHHFSMSY